MNRKENHLSELLEAMPEADARFAQELVQLASTIRPKPRFVDEVAAQLRPSTPINTKPLTALFARRHLALAGTALIVALMFVAVFASPPLRVAAQELFRFFAPAASDTLPNSTRRPVIAAEAGVPMGMEGGPSFQIHIPTMLPDDYGLEQVLISEEQTLTLHYATDGRVLVFEQTFVGDANLPAMGPPEGVFKTQVGDMPAEFTAGLWRPINSGTVGNIESVETLENPQEAATRGLAWHPQSGFNRLRWREDGVRYLLTAAGGSEGLTGYLGMLDLVRVAESLAPVLNNAAAWSVDHFAVGGDDVGEAVDFFGKSVDEVAAQTNFDLLVPAIVPPNYSFDGAAYEATNAETTFAYSCGSGEWRLWILQRRLEPEKAEQQLALLRSQIGASAEVKVIPLDDTTAEYVQGVWVPEKPGEAGAPWVWNSSLNFHQLIWYEDGILYQIRTSGGVIAPYSGPCTLDASALTTMASSLQ